jgi:uncharacterized protein (DUF58 family)
MTPAPAFILVLVVLALVFQLPLFLAIAGVLGALYGISMLWTRYAAAHVQLTRRCPERAFVGDEVSVELAIRNTGRLPIPWVQIGIGVPAELGGAHVPDQVLSLGPHAERTVRYTLVPRRRGAHFLGTLIVETGDMLGLARQYFAAYPPSNLLVYPRIVTLDRLGLPARSPTIALPSPTPLFEDPSRMRGVREYRQGDSWRRIHWTATAGTGTLAVKQWQATAARATLICLDLDLTSYPVWLHEAVEEAIVAAASLANRIITREALPVGLAMEGHEHNRSLWRAILPPRAEREHLMTILSLLARVHINSGGNFLDLLREQSARAPWGTTLAVITGQVSDELADTLYHLKRGGQALTLYIAQPDASRGMARMRARTSDSPVHGVWTNERLRREP